MRPVLRIAIGQYCAEIHPTEVVLSEAGWRLTLIYIRSETLNEESETL